METYHTFFEEYLFHYVPVVPRAVLRALSRRFSRTQCNQMDALVVPSAAMRDKLLEYGRARADACGPHRHPPAQFAAGDAKPFASRTAFQGAPRASFVGTGGVREEHRLLLRALERASPLFRTCCW